MKNRFLILWITAIFFALSGNANKVIQLRYNSWSSYSEFNHNNVICFYVGVEFNTSTKLFMEIEMSKNDVPNDLSNVKIILSNDTSIESEQPNPYDTKNSTKAFTVDLDQVWSLWGHIWGEAYSYSKAAAIDHMLALSKYDITTIELTTKTDKTTKIAINYPTAGIFKEMFRELIVTTQNAQGYQQKAKEFFAPYLKEFPLSTSIASTKSGNTTTSKNSSIGTKTTFSTTPKSSVANSTNATTASATQIKNLNPIQFITNSLGLITDFNSSSKSEISNVLKNAGIKFTEERGDLFIDKPNYSLLGKPITKCELMFRDGLYYTCKASIFNSDMTKSQAMAYAKEIYTYMVNNKYKFRDITKDIGADFAVEYRVGNLSFEIWLYTKYEKGKVVGYEITLIKTNYNGLIPVK